MCEDVTKSWKGKMTEDFVIMHKIYDVVHITSRDTNIAFTVEHIVMNHKKRSNRKCALIGLRLFLCFHVLQNSSSQMFCL